MFQVFPDVHQVATTKSCKSTLQYSTMTCRKIHHFYSFLDVTSYKPSFIRGGFHSSPLLWQLDDRNALHYAAGCGCLEVCEALLRHPQLNFQAELFIFEVCLGVIGCVDLHRGIISGIPTMDDKDSPKKRFWDNQ